MLIVILHSALLFKDTIWIILLAHLLNNETSWEINISGISIFIIISCNKFKESKSKSLLCSSNNNNIVGYSINKNNFIFSPPLKSLTFILLDNIFSSFKLNLSKYW